MSNRSTLAQLRTRAIREADLAAQTGQSGAVLSDEVTDYINDSYASLHNKMISCYGSDYFVRSYKFPLINGAAEYPLPADYMKTRAVYMLDAGGSLVGRMREFLEAERERYTSSAAVPFVQAEMPMYRVYDKVINFVPSQSAPNMVDLRYIYCAPKLLNDNDIVEMQVANGWEEIIVLDVASKMRGKLKLDTSSLDSRLARREAEVMQIASDRDVSQPKRVIDVYGARGYRR